MTRIFGQLLTAIEGYYIAQLCQSLLRPDVSILTKEASCNNMLRKFIGFIEFNTSFHPNHPTKILTQIPRSLKIAGVWVITVLDPNLIGEGVNRKHASAREA